MKIFHHNDLDGKCAGAIALRWAKNKGERAFCIEMDYKDSPAFHLVVKDEIVIITDFSFKPDVMGKMLEITENIFWIDHHKTAEKYPYQHLEGLRDFSDKGQSGCELTWKFFMPYHNIPKAVELIGDYDKWALKFQPECFQFYEGLKMEVTIPESTLWDHLFEGNQLVEAEIIMNGRAAIRYRDNYCEKICNDFGYDIDLEGHKGFATNLYQFGSKGFGERMEKYDFVLPIFMMGKGSR